MGLDLGSDQKDHREKSHVLQISGKRVVSKQSNSFIVIGRFSMSTKTYIIAVGGRAGTEKK